MLPKAFQAAGSASWRRRRAVLWVAWACVWGGIGAARAHIWRAEKLGEPNTLHKVSNRRTTTAPSATILRRARGHRGYTRISVCVGPGRGGRQPPHGWRLRPPGTRNADELGTRQWLSGEGAHRLSPLRAHSARTRCCCCACCGRRGEQGRGGEEAHTLHGVGKHLALPCEQRLLLLVVKGHVVVLLQHRGQG